MIAAQTQTQTTTAGPDDLAQRVAILKRFRELLLAQRDRFRSYLAVLDKQKDVIEQGNAEDLIAHVEIEEQIVSDIFAIQKVIDPLEDMYRAAYPEGSGEVPSLKAALEGLKTEAVVRTGRNKELLSRRMAEIRSEVRDLRRNPYVARPSVYAGTPVPAMIDIQG